LDIKAIESLKLDINVNTIKQAIIKTPRIKLKDQHVAIINKHKFRVEPYDYSSEALFFIMQVLKKKLPNVIIAGIPTINRAVINKEEKNDTLKYNLLVEGHGLRAVMNIPGVDGKGTKSNHIMEVEKVLGIEAARRTIVNEILYILINHSMVVDYRHIGMLADIMTYKGMILGITRFGITKMKDSTLTLASFEKTTDILYDAAIAARQEPINDVSEAIILGDNIPIGTGMFKLLYDPEKDKNLMKRKGKNFEKLMQQIDLKPIMGTS